MFEVLLVIALAATLTFVGIQTYYVLNKDLNVTQVKQRLRHYLPRLDSTIKPIATINGVPMVRLSIKALCHRQALPILRRHPKSSVF